MPPWRDGAYTEKDLSVEPADEVLMTHVGEEQEVVVGEPHVGGRRGWTHPILPGHA